MATQYSDHHAERAFELYKGGVSISAISKRDDMPSRKTVNEWATGGRGTDGVAWKAKVAEIEEQAMLAARREVLATRAKSGDDFLGELLSFIETDAASAVMTKIRMGEFDASIADLDRLARTYGMLHNGSKDKMEFATWFMGKVFEIAVKIMDERQFALFKTQANILQSEVEIKLNPAAHSDAMKQLTK